mmetsp:Transcript_4972/g.6855  ORF Transcript_4972/g.6855 Transcript_4972/m.6855 type:complete len:82 (-) Transcript_4972:179-424(-)
MFRSSWYAASLDLVVIDRDDESDCNRFIFDRYPALLLIMLDMFDATTRSVFYVRYFVPNDEQARRRCVRHDCDVKKSQWQD